MPGVSEVHVSSLLESKGYAVYTVQPHASLSEVIGAFTRHGVSAVIVSANGQTVDGLADCDDVLKHIHHEGAVALNEPVGHVMRMEVACCGLHEHIDHVAHLMTATGQHHVPVLGNGRLVGIVSIGDLLRFHNDSPTMATSNG